MARIAASPRLESAMFRPTCLVLIAAALAAAGCRTSWSDERRAQIEKGAHVRRTLKDYFVIESAHAGKVGYVKVYDVSEGGGPAYPWKYVYDRNWNELGFITQLGSAMRYHRYSPAEQAAQNLEMRGDWLPSDAVETNVMRMLGIDHTADTVSFPRATKADIVGDPGNQNLAGPGVIPQPAVEPATK
jgi:hypothetical protein